MLKAFLFLFLLLTVNAYGQHSLEDFIAKAKENSPLIKDFQNQSQANQLESERLKAFYTKAQVGVTASYMLAPILNRDNGKTRLELNSEGANSYLGYDFASSNGGTYQALLNLNQPLFNGNRYKTANEVLATASLINDNNVRLSGHDLEKIIGDQYILCLQDMDQVTYSEGMISLLNEQKGIIQKLVEGGIYKQSDLILLKIEYQNALGLFTTYKANYQRDLLDLNILSGISDTAMVDLQKPNLTLNLPPESSAFLNKFKLDSLNLVAQQHSFELKYKPSLGLFANTGLNAVYAPTIPKRFGVSAGLVFSLNFFDGHQRGLSLKKTEVLQKTVRSNKTYFLNQNEVRKARILNELKSYTDRMSISEEQLNNYETLLSSYKKEIVRGQISVINYISTVKNRALLQRDYALLIAQKQVLINAYNYWNW